MNKSITSFLLVISIGLGSLTGMGPRGTMDPLRSIAEESTPFDPSHSLTVTAQAFDADQSRRRLSHNLLSKDIVPIQIEIQNNTARSFSLCASSADIAHISPKTVANRVSSSALPRLIAWRIIGFFFWPLMIPGSIDSACTYARHRSLKKDYQAKSLKEEGEILAPYATYHRILFVRKKDMTSSFDMVLIDLDTLTPVTISTDIYT